MYKNYQLTFTKVKNDKIPIVKESTKLPKINESVKPKLENKILSNDTQKETQATYIGSSSTNRSSIINEENKDNDEGQDFFKKLTNLVSQIKESKSQK